jgi:hypothetical protein
MSSIDNLQKPGLLPGSTSFQSNQAEILKTVKIFVSEIENDNLLITDGRIFGI